MDLGLRYDQKDRRLYLFMGNLNAPGFVKFWWKNDIIETHYKSIHEIPVLGIDKT